jgi:hypothetical protein
MGQIVTIRKLQLGLNALKLILSSVSIMIIYVFLFPC